MRLITDIKKIYHNIRNKLIITTRLGYDLEFTYNEFDNAVLLPAIEKKKIQGEFFYYLTLYISSIRKTAAYTYLLNVLFQYGLILIGYWKVSQYAHYFDIRSWINLTQWYMVILLYASVFIFIYYFNYSNFFSQNTNESKILTTISMSIKAFSCLISASSLYVLQVDNFILLLSLISLLALLIILESLSNQLLYKWLVPHVPNMTFQLFIALIYLGVFSKYHADSRDKNSVITVLEGLAENLQKNIYLSNKTSNATFNSWLNAYAKRAADKIRNKEKEIITDNKAILGAQKQLSKILFHYLTGQWGKIASSKNIPATQEAGIKNIVIQISKNLLVGTIPITSIFAFDYFLKIPESVRGYAYFGAFLWLLINLLLLIDPTIGEKMKITKDVMGITEGKK